MANHDPPPRPPEQPDSSSVKEKTSSDKRFDANRLVGQTFDGRYVLDKPIGRGGMGVVYLARQNALDRNVVVKVLPRTFVDDEEAVGRFEREARGMSKLEHPHIVSIYDFGYRDNQAYIVMEYVEGGTLRRLIKSDQPIDFATFGSVALQVLEGISEAHNMGLVHRDIKPSNIMLSERHGDGHYVKILDFGLAKLVKGAQDVTKEQHLVGSVAFLSPEQIMGNETDERVDVYALGVLFYYMLSGHKPFTGDDDVAVLYQHVHTDAEPLAQRLPADHDIPASVIELIHRALSKAPDDRPDDAGQFLFEFGRCLDGADISSPHVSGEFNAVSRVAKLGRPEPVDPSGQLDRRRRETPIHQIPADATPSNANLVTLGSDTHSSQVTWVSGEHLQKVERQNRVRNILLGVLGALLVGGAGLWWSAQQPGGADQQTLGEAVSRADDLIEAGKLGQADSTLDRVDAKVGAYPDIQSQYTATRDHLQVARLLENARMSRDEGDLDGAIETYKKVLNRDSTNQSARQNLRALVAKRRQQNAGPAESDEPPANTDAPAPTAPSLPPASPAPAAVPKPASAGRTPTKDNPTPVQRDSKPAGGDHHSPNDTPPKTASDASASHDNASSDDTDSAGPNPAAGRNTAADQKASDDEDNDDDLLLPPDESGTSTGGDLLPATGDGVGDDGLID